MGREIKFRAWQESQKSMHYEVGLHPYIMTNHTVCDEDEASHVPIGTGKGEHTVLSNQSEWPLMQFTGLKDKNGKDIYEGDIIAMTSKKPTAIIEYDYCSFVFRWIDKHYINNRKQLEPIFWNVHLFEVIGNIHENPDLLC